MERDVDLLVVGATPGGIATAVCAARERLETLLVTYRSRVGGMMASGLSWTDSTVDGPRSPLADEFFDRVAAHYRDTYGVDSEQYEQCNDGWAFEPGVAESVFEAMLADAGVEIEREYHPVSVGRDGSTIESVTCREIQGDESLTVRADAYADATYEGDLYATAGCDYRIGRESREEFGEQYAGQLYSQKGTRLFPGSTGEGDDAVQAYDYRLCLTSDPDNRRPIPKPEGYDREEFLPIVTDPPHVDGIPPARESEPLDCHLKSELVVKTVERLRDQGLEALMLRGPLPNDKRDLNTADLPGAADDYPEGDWETRREIERRHRDHVLGLLYFVANDDAVPEDIRERFGEWGLPEDEFDDGFPFQIYVREGRRLVGRKTFTEHDAREAVGLDRSPVHDDAIAITEYPMDSHDCRPVRRQGSLADGHFFIEEITVPGQLPYAAMLPQDVDNLLVPVACSATHVGYGTVRLEPTWLQIGESAGYAAALATDGDRPPAEIDVSTLQRTLADAGSRLTFFSDAVPSETSRNEAVQFCGTKGFFAGFEAEPDTKLDTATARAWAETTADILSDEVDATARARDLPSTRDEPLTAGTFVELLATECDLPDLSISSLLDSVDVERDSTVTRESACQIVYELSGTRIEQ